MSLARSVGGLAATGFPGYCSSPCTRRNYRPGELGGPPDEQSVAGEAAVEQSGVYVPGYFETRLASTASRATVWKHICAT